MLISIIIDTKNKRSYNESKSPGQKRKGAILMEQQKMLMEKMLQTLEQLSIEDLRKVYAFVHSCAAGDKARIKKPPRCGGHNNLDFRRARN